MEWGPAREQFKEDEAERVEVALPRHFAARQLLWRHVRRGAEADVCRVEAISHHRNPEVHDPHATMTVDHDVAGLQVAMENAFRVGSGQSGTQLPADLDPLVKWQPSDSLKESGKILPINVPHRDLHMATGLSEIVYATYVGMSDLSREPHFRAKAQMAAAVVLHPLRLKKFEGNGLVEFRSCAR